MLAADTNVVVRYVMDDDPAQAAQARKVIDGNDVLIGTTVLLETEWVLRKGYGLRTAQLCQVLRAFAGLPRIIVEDAAIVAQALDWLEAGMDFADALHLAKAAGCEAFVSFDERLAKAARRIGAAKVRAP